MKRVETIEIIEGDASYIVTKRLWELLTKQQEKDTDERQERNREQSCKH